MEWHIGNNPCPHGKPYLMEDSDCYRCIVKKYNGDCYPFIASGVAYALCYYDPNYECKRAYQQGKMIQGRDPMATAEWTDVKEPMWCAGQEYRVKPEEHPFYVYKCSDDTLHISKLGVQLEYELKGTEVECRQYIKEHYCDRCVHQSCDMVAGPQFCKGFKEPKRKRRMTNRELAKWLAQGNGECMCDDIGMSCWRYVCNEDDVPVEDGVLVRGWDEEEWREPEVEE